jgi:tetratricopeptide (TPR) repeat protein
MKSRGRFIVGVALLAAAPLGCNDESGASGSKAAPASPSASTASAAAPSAIPSAAAASKEGKKLLPTTTTSEEARTALVKAWDLDNGGRRQEALAECKKALAADPSCAQAHACIGWVTPGEAGQAELDKAVELAPKLPAVEKLWIEGLSAGIHANTSQYLESMQKVAVDAADDYRAHTWAGRALNLKRDFAQSEAEYKKALELNGAATFLYAPLARAQTQLGKLVDALASAKKYADASPSDPAAHQALALALLNLDKKKEADVEMTKAVELGPNVLSAYYDLANIKAMEGEYAAAKEVLEKGKAAVTQPKEGIARGDKIAWVSFAAGQDAEGLKQLDAIARGAQKDKVPGAWAVMPEEERAEWLWITGKYADAVKVAETSSPRCDAPPEAAALERTSCKIVLAFIEACAQISLGDAANARKAVTAYVEEAKKLSGVGWAQESVEPLEAQVTALEKKDKTAAAALLAKVPADNDFWKLVILRMAERDGDAATADKVRKDLLARPLNYDRNPLIAKIAKK